jgi:hypothetical protein
MSMQTFLGDESVQFLIALHELSQRERSPGVPFHDGIVRSNEVFLELGWEWTARNSQSRRIVENLRFYKLISHIHGLSGGNHRMRITDKGVKWAQMALDELNEDSSS